MTTSPLTPPLLSDDTAPAIDAAAVTTSDSTDLPLTARALYIGTGGNVNLDTISGSTVVFVNLPAGSILPLKVKRVRTTSTTASNIVALY